MGDQLGFAGAEFEQFPWRSREVIHTRAGKDITLVRTLVQDATALALMSAQLCDAHTIAYDTETSGLFPWIGARIVGHSIGTWLDANTIAAWYVPVRHAGAHNEVEVQLDPALVAQHVDEVLLRPGVCGLHHAKFDFSQARADGIRWPAMLIDRADREGRCRSYVDTSLCAAIANENERSFSLKGLGEAYIASGAKTDQGAVEDWMRADAKALGMKYRKASRSNKKEEIITEDALEEVTYLQRFGHARVPIKLEGRYACYDVFLTLMLMQHYDAVRARWPRVWEREHEVERELHAMEWGGLPVRPEEIHATHEATKREVAYWLTRVRELIGQPEFRATDEEMRTLFYVTWKCEVPKETGNGEDSADKESRSVLARRYPQHAPALHAIDRLQKARKLRSTYALGFLPYVSPSNRIHPSYNQLEGRDQGGFPVTGRLSSSDPNIQNIAKAAFHQYDCACASCAQERGVPAGEKRVLSIRRYFTVEPGYVRVYIDYSQVELRVLAWFSQEPRLLECYAKNMDVHAMVADAVTGGDRATSKQVNFGNAYGMTKHGLARRIVWIDPATGRKMHYYDNPDEALRRAEKVLFDYFEWLKGIPIFRREMAMYMRKNGCQFENPFGRPRRIPEIGWKDDQSRARAERKMMSSIISGTSADLMKEGLLRCAAYLRESREGRCVQTIHDELVFDLHHRPGWLACTRKLVDLMTDFPMFPAKGVPILASVAVTTTTWEQKRELEFLPGGAVRWK